MAIFDAYLDVSIVLLKELPLTDRGCLTYLNDFRTVIDLDVLPTLDNAVIFWFWIQS